MRRNIPDVGFVITLRKDGNLSYFRRYLLQLIETPDSNKLLLCTGYISESGSRRGYSILADQMLAAIKKGCNGIGAEVTTVAGRFFGPWKDSHIERYERFIDRITNSRIPINPLIAPELNWHAKIAIKLNGEEPVAMMLGSSNLTRNAYGESTSQFNYESDVVIWSSKNRNIQRYFMNARKTMTPQQREGEESAFSPISAIRDPEVDQPNEDLRMKALYERIKNSGLVNYYEWRKESLKKEF